LGTGKYNLDGGGGGLLERLNSRQRGGSCAPKREEVASIRSTLQISRASSEYGSYKAEPALSRDSSLNDRAYESPKA
jgi:hypothetical protein